MPKIILVSHSKEIASGTKPLLKQMAGDVDIIPIGDYQMVQLELHLISSKKF